MPAKVRMSEPKSSHVWIVFRAHWKQCCDVTQGAPSPVRATWTRVGSTLRANVSDASAFRHASPSSAAAIFHEFCEEATSSASLRGPAGLLASSELPACLRLQHLEFRMLLAVAAPTPRRELPREARAHELAAGDELRIARAKPVQVLSFSRSTTARQDRSLAPLTLPPRSVTRSLQIVHAPRARAS